MIASGERVLQALVAESKDGLYDQEYGSHLKRIARTITGRSDGRKIGHQVSQLEAAGLIHRTARGYAKPTPRGFEVDGILDKITVARGGKFQGRNEAGIHFSESHALR